MLWCLLDSNADRIAENSMNKTNDRELWSYLTNVSRTCIPARDLLIIASSKEQMLSVLIWIEFKTIWNFPICKLGDALTRLSVPQLDKPIVWSRDELFPISWEVQRSDTLGFVLDVMFLSMRTYLIVTRICSEHSSFSICLPNLDFTIHRSRKNQMTTCWK